MKDRLAEFDEQITSITQRRGSVYGHPKDDFGRIALFWSVLFGVKVEPWQVPLAMNLLKISRLMKTPDHLDSWVDLSGYARTGVMVTDK